MTKNILFLKRIAIITILSVVVLSSLVSCAGSKSETPEELSFFAMDTYMTLKVYRGEKTSEEAQSALAAARDAIFEIESALSVTAENSEIAALNRGERVENASAHTVELIRMAKVLNERSGGIYDITVYPLVLAWGFTTEEGPSVPTVDEIEAAMREIDCFRITETENGDGTFNVDAGGAKLDLGSIAKGYAGQIASDVLKERGFDSAILVLGGNVQTLGRKPDGSGFIVGIADPDAPERTVMTVSTADLDGLFGADTEGYAVVTSGSYQRNFTEGDKLYHHILDVRTGFPAESGLSSVTVISTDGAMADGLSTTLFLLGYDEAMEYYRTYGGFEAVFVTDSGEIKMTDGLNGVENDQ